MGTEPGVAAPIWLFPLFWFVGTVGAGFVVPMHYTLLDRVGLGALGAATVFVTSILTRRYARKDGG